MKIAIVGAGISGLTTAFYLQRAHPEWELAIFDPDPVPGGTMSTADVEGFRFEAGGNGFLTNKPDAMQLVEDAGANELLLPSSDAARRRFDQGVTDYLHVLDAERTTVFLVDHEAQELFSRVAQGSQEIRFPMPLTEGLEFKLVGVCDNDCENLDLVLFNPAGEEVASDRLGDPIPLLTVTPEITGEYRVAAQMVNCVIEPCGYVVAAFVAGEGLDRAKVKELAYWLINGPWDVDNDNDGIPDSVWVNLNLAPVQSPDGRWIASAGHEGSVRLWPVPDISKPPLHTLPLDELVAKLYTLSNLRAVRDDVSPTGWKIEVGPFPGWAKVPTW